MAFLPRHNEALFETSVPAERRPLPIGWMELGPREASPLQRPEMTQSHKLHHHDEAMNAFIAPSMLHFSHPKAQFPVAADHAERQTPVPAEARADGGEADGHRLQKNGIRSEEPRPQDHLKDRERTHTCG